MWGPFQDTIFLFQARVPPLNTHMRIFREKYALNYQFCLDNFAQNLGQNTQMRIFREKIRIKISRNHTQK